MKKATIKRRKRIIPTSQDEEAVEAAEWAEPLEHDTTPERGSINEDGSVNLGMRRRLGHPEAIEPHALRQSTRLPSPLNSAYALAAYHQSSAQQVSISGRPRDENRLAPLSSAAAMADRPSSLSPSSTLSSSRKRSFSPELGIAAENGGSDGTKRLSSIKSILNPVSVPHGQLGASIGPESAGSLSLPPLRSPGHSAMASASAGMLHSRGHSPATSKLNGQSQPRAEADGTERRKAERRIALQKEAERMREMLAAKERELQELGD